MKIKILALVLVVVLLLCGCGKTAAPAETAEPSPAQKTVGICLPGSSSRWYEHTDAMVEVFEEKGYRVLVEYGSEDTLLQQSQVQAFVNMPVDCLVVAAFDGLTLSAILESASVPVLAYERLITYTENIAGCVAVDYREMGRQVAKQALERSGFEEREKPLTVELLMGQPQNTNALWYYEGVMEVLEPHFESGDLECRSGRLRFEDTCMTEDDVEEARDICFDYLSGEYEESFPDIFITGSDDLAEGCIQALEGMAFSPLDAWPVVTALGGTEDGLMRLEEGSLTITVAMDEIALAETCASWAVNLLEGVPLPEAKRVFNGVTDVPCYFEAFELLLSEEIIAE